jgi:hypothetical protein
MTPELENTIVTLVEEREASLVNNKDNINCFLCPQRSDI